MGFSEFGVSAQLPYLMGGVAQSSALGKDPCGSWIARGGHRYPLLGMCTYPLLRLWWLLVPPTAGHFWKRAPKVTKRALAPPLGAPPRLGMPAVRHCSVGPPRSAIHGRVAATPASMPGCPLRNTCLRPSWFNGAPEIKIKSQIKSRATAMPEREATFPPCGSWLACDGGVSVDKCIG